MPRPRDIDTRLAEAAFALVGVIFLRHGRDPLTGLDCQGLAVRAAQNAGFDVSLIDETDYPNVPDPEYLRQKLKKHLTQVQVQDAGHGTIVRMKERGPAVHLGVIYERADGVLFVIHAYRPTKKVVFDHITPERRATMVDYYKVPG